MNKVLVAVDGSTDAGSILSVYRSLIRRPEEVVLIRVYRSARRSPATAPGREQGLRPDRTTLFPEQALAGNGRVAVKTVIRCGDPSEEILNIAREEQVDLIIMGDERRSLFRKLGRKCVLEAVERSTTVPVLVAKRSRRKKSYTIDGKEKTAYVA